MGLSMFCLEWAQLNLSDLGQSCDFFPAHPNPLPQGKGSPARMSWKQINSLARRLQFVKLALKARQSMSRLCRLFSISRRTGYKWRDRFEADGLGGLRERSRRPGQSPQQLSSQW